MGRPAKAVIHLEALRQNYRLAKDIAAGGKVLAVVKANAYQHGAVVCARALSTEADGYAVACVDEALELRQAGIRQTVVVLEGVFNRNELVTAAREELDIVVHNSTQLTLLEKVRLTHPVRVWLKMDSGMHRLGLSPAEYRSAWFQLEQIDWVSETVLMTHLSCADNPENCYTIDQLETFNAHTLGLPGARSVGNSAGLIHWPQTRLNWNRPGLMIYGVSPFTAGHPVESRLSPVMELRSELISIRSVSAYSRVGYSGQGIMKTAGRLGVVAIGYADGYPSAPNGTPVLVNGRRASVMGRVSMDMLTVDLTDQPDACIGDPVQLWGRELAVTEVAHCAGTIPYKLFCNLKRVPVEYFDSSQLASGLETF